VTGYQVAVSFPRILAELVPARLPERDLSIAVRAQALLYRVGMRLDANMDCAPDRGAVARALPEVAACHLQLFRLFPPRDPFWHHFERLQREQIVAVDWELRTQKAPPARFDRRLVGWLTRKSALLKWPAAAVCRLASRPRDLARLERVASELIGILQLFDDLVDVEEDEEAGIPNALAVETVTQRRRMRSAPPSIVRASAMIRVCRVLRGLIDDLRQRAPPGTMLARHCEEFARRAARIESIARRRRLLETVLFSSVAAASGPAVSRS